MKTHCEWCGKSKENCVLNFFIDMPFNTLLSLCMDCKNNSVLGYEHALIQGEFLKISEEKYIKLITIK